MRARDIKPGFFKNEYLAELPPMARLLFAGLWCMADREGRLEDRPKRIKAELFPYDDCVVEELLDRLENRRFIKRYTVGERRYIAVLKFSKHQSPHVNEKASTIPAPEEHSACTVQTPEEHSSNPASSLTPSSLTPSSLTPSSLTPDSPFTDSISPRGADAPPEAEESAPESPQTLVAHYVDEYRRVTGTAAKRQRVGQMAVAVKERLEAGTRPDVLRVAITRMVERGRSPSELDLLAADALRDWANRPLPEHEKRLAQLRGIPPEAREFFCRQHGWGDEWKEVSGECVA